MSQTDDFEASTPTNDVEPLKRAWRNEKAAPEILPFEASLIGRIKEQIQLMVFLKLCFKACLVPKQLYGKKISCKITPDVVPPC